MYLVSTRVEPELPKNDKFYVGSCCKNHQLFLRKSSFFFSALGTVLARLPMTIPCFQPKIKIPKTISIENDSVGSPIPDLGAPESSSSDEKSTIEPSISPLKWSKKITKVKRHTYRRSLQDMSDLKLMKELQKFELVFTPKVMR